MTTTTTATITRTMLAFVQVLMILVHLAEMQNSTSEPTLLFIGFRHGARAVVTPLPGDVNNDKWTVGFGELTKQGMRQHYENGNKVRATYAPMFDTYDATKSLMRSSTSDRTLMSVTSFSASLYKPNENQTFYDGLSWQPTAIYTVNFLSATSMNPDVINNAAKKAMANITQEDNDMVQILETATNISATDSPGEFVGLLDNLVSENFAGFSLPYDLNESYVPRIQHLKDCGFIETFGQTSMSCLLAPQILADIVNMTDSYLNQGTQKNAYVYSMHDVNVFSLVFLLNGYNQESPPFAATVFFEIWANDQSNGHTVKLLYRPYLDQDPQELQINNCSNPCSYDDFKNVAQGIQQNCNYNPNSINSC